MPSAKKECNAHASGRGRRPRNVPEISSEIQEDRERKDETSGYPETLSGFSVKAALSPYVKTLSERGAPGSIPGGLTRRAHYPRRILSTSCISSSDAVIVLALAWNARCIWMSEMNSEAMSVVDDSIVFAKILPRPPLFG